VAELKLTPEQEETLIKKINSDFKARTSSLSVSQQWFADNSKIPDTTALVWMLLEKIENLPQKEPFRLDEEFSENLREDQQDLFEEKGISTEGTLYSTIRYLESLLGEDPAHNFIKAFINTPIGTSPEPIANSVKIHFLTLEGPDELELQISPIIYTTGYSGFNEEWIRQNLQDEARSASAVQILGKMSKADREALLKKLDFDCEINTGEGLHGSLITTQPVKKVYLHCYFEADRFMRAAAARISREQKIKNEEIDQDELSDKLIDFFDKVAEQESDYMLTEDYAESYAEYAESDVSNQSLRDLTERVDEEIVVSIDKMEALGMDEDEIKELLIFHSETVWNGGSTNRIGSFSLGEMENQIEFDDDARYEDVVKEIGLPFPDLSDNVALLTEESAAKVSRASDMHVRFTWRDRLGGFETGSGSVYVNSNSSWDCIVDSEDFLSAAKEQIKEMKRERRDKKRGSAASLSQYPTIARIVRS
jgi:hypothetical protein